jgi:hypothetical protein
MITKWFGALAPAACLIVGGAWIAADDPPAAEKSEQATSTSTDAKNLIPNGDFEQGELTPTGWQTVDGLSSFWVDDADAARGKVLRFDSDVLQSQAYEWWAKIADGASPKDAPKKLPTVEPKFDTLAGLDGVWFFSDFVPVEKGKAYWLSLDVKGPEIMVWLMGYPEKGSTAFGADAEAFQGYLLKMAGKVKNERGRKNLIHSYVWKGQLKAGGSDQWKTYSRREKPFRPTSVTPSVRYVRVLLFPYWPPGHYHVDNVRLVKLGTEPRGESR